MSGVVGMLWLIKVSAFNNSGEETNKKGQYRQIVAE